MRYEIIVTVEHKGIINKDLRSFICEDVPGFVQKAVDDIFEGVKVLDCKMEREDGRS